jgi:hypothetical protein
LGYSNDKITVGFSVDFRDQDFSIYQLDTKDYDIDTFWQIGERVGSGSTTEKDFIHAKRQLEARIKNYYR